MKSFLHYSEKIAFVLSIIGIVWWLNLEAGGSTIIALSGLILSIIYFPLGFLSLGSKNQNQRIVSFIVGIGLSCLVWGILFKILNLPGQTSMLWIGIVVTISALVPLFYFLLKKRLTTYVKQQIVRISILLIPSLVLLTTTSDELYAYRNVKESDISNQTLMPPNYDLFPAIEIESRTDNFSSGEYLYLKAYPKIEEFYYTPGDNIFDNPSYSARLDIDTALDEYLLENDDTAYLSIPIDTIISKKGIGEQSISIGMRLQDSTYIDYITIYIQDTAANSWLYKMPPTSPDLNIAEHLAIR